MEEDDFTPKQKNEYSQVLQWDLATLRSVAFNIRYDNPIKVFFIKSHENRLPVQYSEQILNTTFEKCFNACIVKQNVKSS